ncbi:MAG: hypothetical protein Q9208_003398 [Pyrenodesmia sp. 3 TL-2023]
MLKHTDSMKVYSPAPFYLPFARSDTLQKVSEAMEEIRRNGAWSTEIDDPGLGKLSCLPLEVRGMIYQEVFQAFEEDFWMQHGEAYWMQGSYHYAISRNPYGKDMTLLYNAFFKKWGCDDLNYDERNDSRHSVAALRRTSEKIELECDETFLSTRLIMLGCFMRTAWFSSWSDNPGGRNTGSAGWIGFLKGNPFPNLQTAILDLNHDHGQGLYLTMLDGLPLDCDCTSGFHSVQPSSTQACPHIDELRTLAQQPARDLDGLDKVARILASTVPNATIQLAEANKDCRICHEKCKAIMENVVEGKACGLVPTQDAALKWSDMERSTSILEIERRHDYDSAADQARLRQIHFRYFAA